MVNFKKLAKKFFSKNSLTQEGALEFADLCLAEMRKEQILLMNEQKSLQKLYNLTDEEKNEIIAILDTYTFSSSSCGAEYDECWLEMTIGQTDANYTSFNCAFYRENAGKQYWCSISPVDYFYIIQLNSEFAISNSYSYPKYHFFQTDIIDIIDGMLLTKKMKNLIEEQNNGF